MCPDLNSLTERIPLVYFFFFFRKMCKINLIHHLLIGHNITPMLMNKYHAISIFFFVQNDKERHIKSKKVFPDYIPLFLLPLISPKQAERQFSFLLNFCVNAWRKEEKSRIYYTIKNKTEITDYCSSFTSFISSNLFPVTFTNYFKRCEQTTKKKKKSSKCTHNCQ